MNLSHPKHATTELLSAYLDHEIDLVKARALEAHLETCLSCRRRLSELQSVVGSLGRLEREAPPPWLGQRVRHAMSSPRPSLWERFARPLLQVPRRSPIGSTLSMAVALGILLLGASAGEQRRGLPGIASYPGPAPYPDHPIPTTIVVAGRTFVLSRAFPLREDEDVWVEQGLLGRRPEARVRVTSPEGRALLARYQDLGYLLADGSRVVMRYRRETLELSAGL
jgi:Putative zinc-finger